MFELRKNKNKGTVFDDFFDAPFFEMNPMMKTDVEDVGNAYLMQIEIPGYRKEDIRISIDNGNLIVEAKSACKKEETDESHKIIYQERHFGNVRRSFYIGNVPMESIAASYENGILSVSVMKQPDQTKYIPIV